MGVPFFNTQPEMMFERGQNEMHSNRVPAVVVASASGHAGGINATSYNATITMKNPTTFEDSLQKGDKVRRTCDQNIESTVNSHNETTIKKSKNHDNICCAIL